MVAVGQLGRQRVASCLQVYRGRGRGRQPQVLHLHHRLTVHAEVMTARHLLSHVEQQGIVAFLGNVDGGGEDVALAHLLLSTFRRSHVHHFRLAAARLPFQSHAVLARVQLRQSVVVPQQTPSLAREHHGNRYLRVHLRQPSRQSAQVGLSVLELSEAEQTLVLGRRDGQRHAAVCRLVPGCGEGCAMLFVDDGHDARCLVGFHFEAVVFAIAVVHIDPFGQVTCPAVGLCIPDSDGIAAHFPDRETALPHAAQLCHEA